MMNSATIVTLMATMTLLKRDDSLVPTMSSAVMAAMISIAGRLTSAPVVDQTPVAAS